MQKQRSSRTFQVEGLALRWGRHKLLLLHKYGTPTRDLAHTTAASMVMVKTCEWPGPKKTGCWIDPLGTALLEKTNGSVV